MFGRTQDEEAAPVQDCRRSGEPHHRKRHRPTLQTRRAGRQASIVHRQPGSAPVQERPRQRRYDSLCRELRRFSGRYFRTARG